MSITTVDVNDELLAQAKDALGTSTIKATVEAALREVVMRKAQLAALDALATVQFDTDATKNDIDNAA